MQHHGSGRFFRGPQSAFPLSMASFVFTDKKNPCSRARDKERQSPVKLDYATG